MTPSKSTLKHHIHKSFTCLQSAWPAGIPCCKCWNDSYFWKMELKKYYLTIASFGKFLINEDEDENEGDVEMLINLVDVLETMDICSGNISVNDFFLFDANQMEFAFPNLQDNQSTIAKRIHVQHFKRSDRCKRPCSQEFFISCCKAVIPHWLIQGIMTWWEIFMFASSHLVKLWEQTN